MSLSILRYAGVKGMEWKLRYNSHSGPYLVIGGQISRGDIMELWGETPVWNADGAFLDTIRGKKRRILWSHCWWEIEAHKGWAVLLGFLPDSLHEPNTRIGIDVASLNITTLPHTTGYPSLNTIGPSGGTRPPWIRSYEHGVPHTG